MNLPKYNSPIKRYYKLFKKAVGNATLFLLSLQFEPNMYKKYPLWFLLVPVREVVSGLKLNTLIGKTRRVKNKTKKVVRFQFKALFENRPKKTKASFTVKHSKAMDISDNVHCS